jgi:hypothetical protein
MPSERRLPKRSAAKDGNKSKKPRRGGKAGSKAVHSETEEGRVLPTEAATVAVPEMVAVEKEAVEKEGSIVAPETAEAEKEQSLAAVSEVVANEKERSLVSETVENEKERSLALEMLVVDKEVDAGAFMFFSWFFCLFVALLINFITTLYNDCMYGL